MKDNLNGKKILEIIYDTIDEVNESNPDEMKLAKSLKTIIIGNGGVLDSLGIINFIISN